MGIVPKDFDVEVYGISIDSLAEVLAQFGTVDLVGKQFGVLKLHGIDADFSVPRRENKIGIGHRGFSTEVDSTMSPTEAASRRDLTINSMLQNPFTGVIFDPFNGKLDLQNKTLRATNPERFLEDSLRALRVCQFAARFDMQPDPTLVDICKQADLSDLPGERIYEEFKKLLLKGKKPGYGFELLRTLNLARFMPEIHALDKCPQHHEYHAEGDTFTHTGMALNIATGFRNGDEKHDLALMFGIMCHDLGKPPTTKFDEVKNRWVSNSHDEEGVEPTRTFLNRLRAPNDLIDTVCVLVREHLQPFMLVKQNAGLSAYRRLSRRMGNVSIQLLSEIAISDGEGRICNLSYKQQRTDIEKFLKLCTDAGVDQNRACTDIVMGRHVLARGVAPGPQVGEVLKKCRVVQDETGLIDPKAILDQVLSSG